MLNVGDRVVCTVDHPDGNYKIYKGYTGTIRHDRDRFPYRYGVEFDKDIDGHSLDGLVNNNQGWWMREDELKLLVSPEEGEEFDVDESIDILSLMF